MPQPTSSAVHVNAPLSNISVAYMQDASVFHATDIFPTVPVAKQSDLYYTYDKSDFLRDEAKPRAPGTESAGGGFRIATASYACRIEAFHKDIDDPTRANADSVLSLDASATRLVTHALLLRREKKWVSNYFGSGIWATDITPGTLWSAASGSTPQKDVETGKLAIQSVTGRKPNTLVLGARVLAALRTNPEVKDQFKYTSSESIDMGMLAGFFGIDRIVVLEAINATAKEGAASQTYDFVAGKHALLCYSNPNPSLFEPSAGYTFSWTGLYNSGMQVKKFRMENLESDRIEGSMAHDMKVVAADCGYFFASVVA